MDIKVYTLFSGSKGNCIYFRYGKCALMIDAGVSKKSIEGALGEIGENLEDISAILVTHEHCDHIKGLPMISKYYSKIPIFIPQQSYLNMVNREGNFIPYKKDLILNSKIENVRVESFKTSHDSAASVGYIIYTPDGKVAVCTDTGIVENDNIEKLKGCSGIVIESNYDKEMLRCGSYPPALKSRIASKHGHLSNVDCGNVLNQICGEQLKSVIISHLSEENNTPQVAYDTVVSIFNRPDVKIQVAKKAGAVQLF